MKRLKNLLLRLWHSETGVAAVEYAMIAPFLFFIMIGVTDYGMYIHKQMIVQETSRSAAQYVVAGGKPENVMQDVVEQSKLYTEDDAQKEAVIYDAVKECTCSDGVVVDCSTVCTAGDYMRSFYAVTIDATYTTLFPYPGIPNSIPLKGYTRLQYDG